MGRRNFFIALALAALVASSLRDVSAQSWTLSWSDEFDGPAGSAPDQSKWTHDIGIGPNGDGWGNNELEYYTDRTDNAYLDGNGNLVIKAIKETFTKDGVTRNYTSARLLTKGYFTQKYGRFEARIKLPFGQGIWPAFWMLGADFESNPWPACGEIDIMENIGSQPSTNHASMHGPGYSGANPLPATYTLPNGQKFSDDFHVFALEWAPGVARFYVDGNLYGTHTPAEVSNLGSRWVFDHPFFIILNVAVGGNFPHDPDSTTVFPQTMLVDYVRVYSDSTAPSTKPTITGVATAGKNLIIGGANFDSGSVLLVDMNMQRTLHDDQNPTAVVIGKKTLKRLTPGTPVMLQVENSDGAISDAVPFTR